MSNLTVVAASTTGKGIQYSVRKVSFSYPGANQKAVDDISFTITQGRTVALVGASGGGKTTIARLVPRFWGGNRREGFNRWHQCKRNRP